MSANTDIARLVGRLALALIFILSGLNKITNFAAFSEGLGAGGLPLPQVLTVLAIALELGSALALAAGFHGRLAALGLLVFTILATATRWKTARDFSFTQAERVLFPMSWRMAV